VRRKVRQRFRETWARHGPPWFGSKKQPVESSPFPGSLDNDFGIPFGIPFGSDVVLDRLKLLELKIDGLIDLVATALEREDK
jgi:hypothetical protein